MMKKEEEVYKMLDYLNQLLKHQKILIKNYNKQIKQKN